MLKNYLVSLWTGPSLIEIIAEKLLNQKYHVHLIGSEHILVWVVADNEIGARTIAAVDSYGYPERALTWACKILRSESIADAAE